MGVDGVSSTFVRFRLVKGGALTRWAVASLAFVSACGGGGPSTPSATVASAPKPQHTTTTLSLEQQVEAAYLKSWDVYAHAMRTFDTSQLANVYVGKALNLRLEEVARLKRDNSPARTVVTHNITQIRLLKSGEAVVHDDYENHSVLLDGKSGEPIESDPDNIVKRQYAMRYVDRAWKIWLVISA